VEFIQGLMELLWTRFSEKLSRKYPVLVGVPLMLLPIFIMAGIIYLIAR
jgi:hypothetical protein